MHVFSELEKRLRMRLVTSEFEVVSWLFMNGSTSSRDLSRQTMASIANFQLIVRRLKDDGVLITRAGEEDRRVREYDLSDQVRAEISDTLQDAGLDSESIRLFARTGGLAPVA